MVPSIHHCAVLSLNTYNRNIFYSAERIDREEKYIFFGEW